VQAIGSFAVLATIAYLAHSMGTEAQGLFSSLKAEFDFYSAFLLVGLPQSIFYFVASKEQDRSQALTFAILHASVSLVIIAIWTVTAMYGSHVNFPSLEYVLFFSLAVTIGIFFSDARALVLAIRPAITFSVVTALPPVTIFVVVLISVNFLVDSDSSGSTIANPAIFVFAYGLATIVAITIIGRPWPFQFVRPAIRDIARSLRYGLATWVPAIAQAGSTLFAIRWLGKGLTSLEDIAGFSSAFALVLAILTPLSMVVPILFKWWAPLAAKQRDAELTKGLGIVFLLSSLGFLLVWLFEGHLVRVMFGAEYLKFSGVYTALAATVLPQAAFRMWGVYCNSSGRPSDAAWLEAVRLVIVVICVATFGVDLASTVYAWILAEYITLLLGAFIAAYLRARNIAKL
jgi:O-antigen/teichoic acid export membrane protein